MTDNPLVFIAFSVAILVAIFGVWRKKRWLCVVSGILSLPLSFYLFRGSDLRLAAWLAPLGFFFSEWSLQRKHFRLAWMGVLPALIMFVMLLVAVWVFTKYFT